MLKNLRIALIGAGAMGEAILAGLLRQELVGTDQIIATEPREERRRELQDRYNIILTEDNVATAQWAQVLIIAVKPQMLTRILPPLRGTLSDSDLCVSIAAGVPMRVFVDSLDHPLVVRSMPNTPAQIGAGMTVWTATPAVGAQQRAWASIILGALGRERYLDDESYLDMATALSGSGPAYCFTIMEAMIDAGVHLGLPRTVAEELVTQTMLGAAQYARQNDLHLAQLRNAVTSPGGTTAAALAALDQGRLRAVLSDAVWAAYLRSVELGLKT